MHIHLINPNSTASMTAQALDSALLVKHSNTKVSASNPADTPVSIEGGADEALAVPGMLAEIRKGEAQGVDAYVIACFDDPGLHAAREIAKGPVLGICQAAVQVAMTISRRFSIITTLRGRFRSSKIWSVITAQTAIAEKCVRSIYRFWVWKKIRRKRSAFCSTRSNSPSVKIGQKRLFLAARE